MLLLCAAIAAQLSFEQAIQDLASPDAGTRLKIVQMLKAATYPEAAVPLAKAVTDSQDQIQLEAIAAELNIFLAEQVVPRKRVGFVVEVRTAISADAAFSEGPLAVGARPVPPEVLAALRTASRDDNPRVALEALYAFGALGANGANDHDARGPARAELLRTSAPELAALVGTRDPALRYAALRVIGRLYARRAGDGPADESLGDAVIVALNDKDRAVAGAAMQALGAMRYDRAVTALTELFTFFARGPQAEASLDALAHIANGASAPLFAAQLTSKSSALKGIAVEGLARAGDRARLPEMQSALASERSEPAQLAGVFAEALLANGSLARIGEALANPRLREQAKQYLVELAPGRSSQFAAWVKDPDVRVRVDAIDALALGGDRAALPLVEPLAKDADPAVARAAQRAIAWLR